MSIGEPFSMLQLYLPIQAGLSMKGLFSISSIDDFDNELKAMNSNEPLSATKIPPQKSLVDLSTDDQYTSSSDLELENLISSNNAMI